MKYSLKNLFLALTVGLLFAFTTGQAFAQVAPVDGANPPATNPVTSSTDSSSTSAGKADACDALKELDASKSCGTGSTSVSHLIGNIINILSVVVGIAAVIVIIVSGLKYVTSGGDSAGISSAKNTLVYALIGLAVAALAQALVHFVLYNVAKH